MQKTKRDSTMKKSFILLALTSTLLVTGCQQSRDKFDDHFKEYSFKSVIKDTGEQIAIEEGISKNSLTIASIEMVEESYANNSYVETSATRKSKIHIKEDKTSPDNLIVEKVIAEATSTYDNGISYKESSKSEIKAFDRNGKFYAVTAKTENGKTKKTSDSTDIGVSSKEYKETYLKTNYGKVTTYGSRYYSCDDGTYAIVYSSIDKSVTAQQWGSETKELVITQRYQVAYFIDKDYKITSYYSYSDTNTNRNPNTGEWYDSEKLFSRSYKLVKYKYGKRDNVSLNALVEYMNKK